MCFGVTMEGDGGISLVGYFQDVAYFFCFFCLTNHTHL